MGQTTALRNELKRVFEPLVVDRGFAIDRTNQPISTEFRRAAGASIHVFSVQWEKYGAPRFALHFGTCPSSGLKVNGKTISWESVLPTWLPVSGILSPRAGMSSRSWFRQDPSFLGKLVGREWRSPSEVIAELITLFPEVEQYWVSGAEGPHLRIWRR